MKPNEFESVLHEDLFNLLIMHYRYSYKYGFFKPILENVYYANMKTSEFEAFLDLFPLEIAPEEFEGYVGDNFERCLEFGALVNKNNIHWFYRRKIKFRFEE